MILALAGSSALGLPLYAQTTKLEEAAVVFGSREHIADISLSPSGNKLAYISPVGNSTEVVYVVNLAGNAEPVPITKYEEKAGRLTSCDWATEERLLQRLRYREERKLTAWVFACSSCRRRRERTQDSDRRIILSSSWR